MLGLQTLARAVRRLTGAAPPDSPRGRSPRWPAVRRLHLAAHPACAACEARADLDVHHILPVHLCPSSELVPHNLVTLCRRCHLFLGHLGRWDWYNVDVLADAEKFRANRERARQVAGKRISGGPFAARLVALALLGGAAPRASGDDTLPPPPPLPIDSRPAPRAAIREEDPLGGPTLVLLPEVKAAPGRLVFVKADTPGRVVRWQADPELSLIPAELLRDTKTAVVLTPATPGRYRVRAVTAAGDTPSRIVETVIVVGDAPPPAPPGPGPTPPGPGPGPEDPLAARLRAAWRADAATPGAAEHAKTLAGFFAAMAGHTRTATAKTVGDLLADYRGAIPAVLPEGAVPALRKAAGAEVAGVAGTDPDAPLDPALRPKLADLFAKLSTALGALR